MHMRPIISNTFSSVYTAVHEAAKLGDPIAQDIVSRTERFISQGIVNGLKPKEVSLYNTLCYQIPRLAAKEEHEMKIAFPSQLDEMEVSLQDFPMRPYHFDSHDLQEIWEDDTIDQHCCLYYREDRPDIKVDLTDPNDLKSAVFLGNWLPNIARNLGKEMDHERFLHFRAKLRGQSFKHAKYVVYRCWNMKNEGSDLYASQEYVTIGLYNGDIYFADGGTFKLEYDLEVEREIPEFSHDDIEL